MPPGWPRVRALLVRYGQLRTAELVHSAELRRDGVRALMRWARAEGLARRPPVTPGVPLDTWELSEVGVVWGPPSQEPAAGRLARCGS